MSRIVPLSLSSSDRDYELYPDPNHYVAQFPFPLRDVVGLHLASLEMPGVQTQLTIETDINDKFTFSEGLRIDLGEALRTVQSTSMFNNQLMIQENSRQYIVSVPSYLAQITGFGGSNEINTTDTASSGTSSWYACYVAWRSTYTPTPPPLQVIGGSAGYLEEVSSTGTLGDTSQNANFLHGFVHLDALGIHEICSYLTYAFANYATYSSSPATAMSNTYTFQYYLGKVHIRSTGSTDSPTLHFPMTANASQTAFYGSQHNGFTNRLQLNSDGQTITSLGYMLGLSSNLALRTKSFVFRNHKKQILGFFAYQRPRFLFEARLLPGLYTQNSLAEQLPVAMNPLHFASAPNIATQGTCFFGFVDSAHNEKIVVISQGKYTPETFCQALEHAFNRLDENGLYFSTSRFAYAGAPLNHERSRAWPDVTLSDKVVYNVYFDFNNDKFVIESSWASSVKPFDPSTATTLDTSKPPPVFGLLFDPASVTRVAAQAANLSSLCTNANLYRIANVLGFRMQDYHESSSYTSELKTYFPRIPFPLSQGFPPSGSRFLFRDQNPENLGMNRGDATSCGTPAYLYPRGRYRAVGFVPTRQNLNVSSGMMYVHESFSSHLGVLSTTAPSVAIANNGFQSSDYTLAPPSSGGTHWAPNMYAVIDNLNASSEPEAATLIKVTSTTESANTPISEASVIDVGTGATNTPKTFSALAAHDNVRMLGVTNVASDNERCMLVSTHSNGLGSLSQAYATTVPFGFQVGDIVRVKGWTEALVTNTTSGVTIALGATLSTSQGLKSGTIYGVTGGTAVLNEYHVVLGGHGNALVQVTTAGGSGVGQVQVVEPGSGYYPSATYTLSDPIMAREFEGVVVQQANSGAHFQDSDNSQQEQFYASVPNLGSSLTCCAAKSVDGACVRIRIPYALDQYVSTYPRAGNLRRIAEYLPPRLDVHVEAETADRMRAGHANEVLGVGRQDLLMALNLTFPSAMNVDPVHYALVKFVNINNRRSEQIHFTDNRMVRDIVGKVILGAPTTLVRSVVTRIEFAPTTLTQVEIVFYLPDGKTKYRFHGREHTLTINCLIQPPQPHQPPQPLKRKAEDIM